ncbi:MAG: S-formylglutathione hydrolase [Woeseiaceae bacterium]
MSTSIETIAKHACFGGQVGFYRHTSEVNNCTMQFSVFVPGNAAADSLPVVTYLAGLTCTEETFMIKGGAQRVAAELGVILVAPDTSPRGDGVPDDPDGAYDFGLGAGFYLNATQSPWDTNFNMYDYVTKELPDSVCANFPADRSRQGITGHSMGGHGALTIGLKNPETYQSISAFAPICSPVNCPWGQKALGNYLGNDQSAWQNHDATEIARSSGSKPANKILIDQGMSDQFLDSELHPHLFEAACSTGGIELELRRHVGYDHGYFFIASFMEDHIRHHAAILCP